MRRTAYWALTILTAVTYVSMVAVDMHPGAMSASDVGSYSKVASALLGIWIIATIVAALSDD